VNRENNNLIKRSKKWEFKQVGKQTLSKIKELRSGGHKSMGKQTDSIP
jgi:hypothetical protein